jgi:hypothetical protein
VQFDGAAQQNQLELAELSCDAGLTARFSQRDAAGLTSIQTMELRSLSANHQTGAIKGLGPGWIESVHLAGSQSPLAGFAPVGANAASAQQLRFLRVEFQRGVLGDLNNEWVEVVGNTHTVYGPVDSWEQRLAVTLQGRPARESFWIGAERLRVGISPLAKIKPGDGLGPIELLARGNVTIEGRAGKDGSFTTRSETASYDQQKTVFSLEGEPATVYIEEYPGAARQPTSARTLRYNATTGELGIDQLYPSQWQHIELGRQPDATGAR